MQISIRHFPTPQTMYITFITKMWANDQHPAHENGCDLVNNQYEIIWFEGHQLPDAYSQIAYGKLCARLVNYLIWWVRVIVEGWGFG